MARASQRGPTKSSPTAGATFARKIPRRAPWFLFIWKLESACAARRMQTFPRREIEAQFIAGLRLIERSRLSRERRDADTGIHTAGTRGRADESEECLWLPDQRRRFGGPPHFQSFLQTHRSAPLRCSSSIGPLRAQGSRR